MNNNTKNNNLVKEYICNNNNCKATFTTVSSCSSIAFQKLVMAYFTSKGETLCLLL